MTDGLLDDFGLPTRIGFRVGLCRDYMPVPYPKKTREDGMNHGYVNAKGDLSAIAQIPEINGWPELEDFLRAVNTPGGIFCTIGCDATVRDHDGSKWVSVFVQLAFDVAELNKFANYFELFSQYAVLRKKTPPSVDTYMDIELSKRHWIERDFRGWSAMVTHTARGESESEARGLWQHEFEIFKKHLVQESHPPLPASVHRLS